MNFFRILLPLLGTAMILNQCAVAPPAPDQRPPDIQALEHAEQRVCAIVVTKNDDIRPWIQGGFSRSLAPKDADAGTASPITSDGYLLTADHVIKNHHKGNIHVMYGRGANLQTATARVVWRETKHDLALIHVPISTPLYYQFSPPSQAIAEGSTVFHGGLTTGLKPLYGALASTIPAQHAFTSAHRFPIDIPLKPGDSGGPILDAHSRLVGVNSSVEFLVPLETPIFTESQGTRPNVMQLMKIIQRDRRR